MSTKNKCKLKMVIITKYWVSTRYFDSIENCVNEIKNTNDELYGSRDQIISVSIGENKDE